jgi:hypothetical protein
MRSRLLLLMSRHSLRPDAVHTSRPAPLWSHRSLSDVSLGQHDSHNVNLDNLLSNMVELQETCVEAAGCVIEAAGCVIGLRITCKERRVRAGLGTS